jgi:HK97 family phage prohead protease
VPFARDHLALGGHIIGKTLELREEDDGLYGKWLISRTALGEETIELLKDGALDQLSIGFRELPGGTRTRNGISVRTRAHLLEVAVVQNGAYGEGAAVSDIRSEVPETPNLAAARSVLSSLPVLPTW